MNKKKITKQQKEHIIKLLQEGKDLPEEFKYLLFPIKQKEYELVYAGKIRKEDLLANEDGVFPVPIQVDKVFNGAVHEPFEDNWKNMIIFGDNLQFLKTIYENKDPLIKDKVKGEVKLIYIDPPFGTGDEYEGNKGQSAYSAKRKGADFIEFLRRRLILAREILANDGIIVVRNAFNFGHYVKIILDEIFSKENFINEIIINRKRKSMGSVKKYEVANEYLYVYSKTSDYYFENQWAKKPLSKIKWTSFLSQEERKPKERYVLGLKFLPPKGQHFSLNQEKTDKLLKEHFLRVRHRSGALFYYSETGNDDNFYKKISTKGVNKFKYQDITTETEVYGVKKIKEISKFKNAKPEEFKIEYLTRDEEKITNDWTDIPSYTDTMGYPTENSEVLLERIIKSFTKREDLILDFFAGSGTTSAVAEKLGRRWIIVDIGKLAYYTMQKRILQIQASKDLENPKKKYCKKARSFITARLGLYDLGKVFELQNAKYKEFVSQLFEVEIKPFQIAGFQFDGKKGEYPVKIFDYRKFKDSSVDEEYLKSIHAIIGKRVTGRIYVIAPANYVDFLADYHEIDGLRYYFLKIPYQVIKELHKIPFQKLRQPQSKKNVNDLDEVIGFHFIRQPEVKSKIKIRKDFVDIEISEFRSQYYKDEAGKVLENFETLAMVLIDSNYNGNEFVMDKVYFADELLPKKQKKKEENEEEDIRKALKVQKNIVIRLKKKEVRSKIMVVYVDIYGNEFRETFQLRR